MRGGLASCAAGVAISCVVGNAWGADVCAKAPELTALQVAAVQQQLMVAAFACNDVSLYNQFVLEYRDELQGSDRSLQAFFTRMDETTGAAEYHTFKTKMANIYSLRSNANKKGFCQSAKASFDAALSGEKRSLASFVLTQPISINEPYTNCGTTIAGVSTRAGGPKPNVIAAKEAAAEVAAEKALPAENEPPLTVAAATHERPPIEKIMPLRAQDAVPAKEEKLPMIAEAPVTHVERVQENVPPPQIQPDNNAARNATPPEARRPPSVSGNSYSGRSFLPPPPPRPPQRYTAQRPVPPQYRRYYAGGPYARSPYPYGNPYYDRYTPPPPYYRSPYGPNAPYRTNPYYQERNDRALERAPYRGDDRSDSYDNEDDRSNYRAPNDPRFYPRDRFGDYPPQRY
jgi:hypothetical protein